ncbi:MAG TPA: response regulator [Dictyobacter sp.]|jgi:DNA-binding response OmpR family regulator|nr:response regulator [Dictyobacter sp.]
MSHTILVVDDDEGIVEVVQIVLESEGYEVLVSMDGEYFSHLGDKDNLPDLILLDVLLSGANGRDICTSLKQNERTKHIPVLMLSAHSDARKVAHTSGADDFLEKPFDVDELISIVARHLSTSSTSNI